MVNVTMSEPQREGMDFFPLQVDFEEKMYAVGKIPGGFKKREGRASDQGYPHFPPHRQTHPSALPEGAV